MPCSCSKTNKNKWMEGWKDGRKEGKEGRTCTEENNCDSFTRTTTSEGGLLSVYKETYH
jgi:hypothetical protein